MSNILTGFPPRRKIVEMFRARHRVIIASIERGFIIRCEGCWKVFNLKKECLIFKLSLCEGIFLVHDGS